MRASGLTWTRRQRQVSRPRVFVSYSWDDEGHKRWVGELATDLHNDGVETRLDQWHTEPGDLLPAFMANEIKDSDFVLVVCTPNYRRRSEERRGGVAYEDSIMTAEVVANDNHRKYIPVLARGSWEEAAPSWLKGRFYVDLSTETSYRSHYKNLLRKLRGQRAGPPPVRPPTDSAEAASGSVSADDLYNINSELIERYNSEPFFADKVKLIRISHIEPRIYVAREELFDTALLDDNDYVNDLRRKGHDNDLHGAFISTDDIDWRIDPAIINYQPLYWSQIQALRKKKEENRVMSCNALLICNETGELVLNKRSEDVYGYKSKLHIFGGGRFFEDKLSGRTPDLSFWEGAKREVREELCIEIPDGKYPIYIGEELDLGYLQISFLGVPICESQLKNTETNWEGEWAPIRFGDLQHWLTQRDSFVPSALMHIMCWLRLGAPGAKKEHQELLRQITFEGKRIPTRGGGGLE